MVVLRHWECTTCHCLYTLKQLTLCCTDLSSKKEHPTFWTARLKTNILCPIESILCLTRSLPSCGHPVGPLGILRNSWTTVASWVAKWVVATRNMAAASVHLGWGRKAPQSTQPELVGFRAFRSSLSLVPTPLHTHTHTHTQTWVSRWLCHLSREPTLLMQQRHQAVWRA